MLHFRALFALGLVGALAVAKPQISFGEEEQPAPAASVAGAPKREVEGPALSDEVVSVRLGLLAGYLNLDPVPGVKPISPQSTLNDLQNNPLVPQGGNGPRGNCLCVPLGKCARPPPPGANIPPGSGIVPGGGAPVVPPPVLPPPVLPPPGGPVNTDGAGLIDVRIVNRPPPGVTCQNGFQYCCLDIDNVPPVIPPIPPQRDTGSCGKSNIIPTPGYNLDPTQARFGEFPWMVVILGPNNNYIGGGALITPRHVLTAAHKVANYGAAPGIKVRLGEWDAKANTEPFKYQEIGVAKVSINPLFNRANLQNDVAILTLEIPADVAAPHIETACMPKFANSYIGRRCWVTGWGKDAFGPAGNFQYILKRVDVPILDPNDCENRLRKTRLGPFFQLSRTSFICAGGEAGKDACSGDGGSPLVCENNGLAEVVGLVAWGIGCADPGIPGVYVNVPSYSSWIQSQLV